MKDDTVRKAVEDGKPVVNVALCPPCWGVVNPGRTPVRVVGAQRPRYCARCEALTRDPIGVRMTVAQIEAMRP